ncbi:unnamed protein product [Adineta ricciae]|nr:unnamed protein product [Adineta ricciae]
MVTRDSTNKKEILDDDRSLANDNGILMRCVAARLDLPISMRLVERGFKLSIIKRCWEDQLQIKHDDFIDECDLMMAYMILQKQIDCIAGKNENIIVPHIAMYELRSKENIEIQHRAPKSFGSMGLAKHDPSKSRESSTSPSDFLSASEQQHKVDNGNVEEDMISTNNCCVLCFEEEKCLACLPCGHLATCIPCGHSLRKCPICRNDIDGFVKIHM